VRCLFCRTELDSVHWAFDGVSEQPVPACKACCERLHVRVWRVDVGGGTDLPLHVDCFHCGTPLPSADTRPVIVWVKGEHGVDGVCNACRVRYDRETLFVTQPREEREEDEAMDNPELLERLFASGGIDLCRGELFDRCPPPLPTTFDWDRVDGMLLGLAIGDALGNTTESLLPERRHELYGEIRDYVPHRWHKTLATPTDDTQLAFWTLEQMLADDGFIPEQGRSFSGQLDLGVRAFQVDVSPETLARSNLAQKGVGDRVNLERALRLGDRLGGHLVTGHVDGLGVLRECRQGPGHLQLTFELPPSLAPLVIEKGSIAVDGVSLTVNAVRDHTFTVNIIPYTAKDTTLVGLKVGDRVNLETDIIGKYVAKLLGPHLPANSGLTAEFLKSHGFG